MRKDFSINSDGGSKKAVDYSKLDTDYIPEEFPHRDKVIDDLFNSVYQPLLEGRKAENYVLQGRSGTGKTAITKALAEWVSQDNPQKAENYEYAFINCSRKSSYKRVLQGVADELDIEWKEGVANDQNSDRIFREINNREKPVLIALDELDFLKRRSGRSYINKVLYALTRPREMCPDDEWNASISILAISNDRGVMDYISEDNLSKADPAVRDCKRYTKEELIDILKQRYDLAFQKEVLNDEAIETIADEVEDTYDSDIRKGIKILEKTTEVEKSKPVDIAEEAIKKYKDRYIERVLQSSDKHELMVLKSLCTNLMKDKKTLKRVNEGYRQGCEKHAITKKGKDGKSSSRPHVYRTLDKLAQDQLITKRKAYDKTQNPYVYETNLDLERMYRKVEEKLERKGFSTDSNRRQLDAIETEREKEAKKEAEEKMNELM